MSVLIIGGNECMERRYVDICRSYSCSAKVFTKLRKGMQDIGNPDLVVFFTGTMSHKMLEQASTQARKRSIPMVHCRSGSVSALKSILEASVVGGQVQNCVSHN